MTMKKRTIMLTAVLLLLSIPVFLAVCAFALPEQYGDTFMGALKYKVRRLDETGGSRIILVGGSGVAFGTDCSLLEQELPGYSAVNFGMYAALGTGVMLDLSEGSIRPGDIVILCPEQNAQTLTDYFNAETLWQGMDGAFSLLGRLHPERWESMLGSFPRFAGSKLRYVLAGRPEGWGVYRRDAFNAWGDVEAERANNIMPGQFDVTMPVTYTGAEISEEFIAELNAYAEKARSKGAAVYYRFCPVNRLAVTEGDVEEYYDFLCARLDFPILGDPTSSVMDAGWFYDTNFHLNSAGAVVNTRQLVRDLKVELSDSSPTMIAVPPMPEPEFRAFSGTGDSSDAGYFLYESFGDGLKVTGLTEEGKAQSILTVPIEADGAQVTAIAGGAFSGSRAREVVIQGNVASIMDGAFADSALERIVLTEEYPTQISVGQGLLDGTGANIFVPESALNRYRVSYFWSPYASRIHPAASRR